MYFLHAIEICKSHTSDSTHTVYEGIESAAEIRLQFQHSKKNRAFFMFKIFFYSANNPAHNEIQSRHLHVTGQKSPALQRSGSLG